jgi:hypothetical protein
MNDNVNYVLAIYLGGRGGVALKACTGFVMKRLIYGNDLRNEGAER